jgi:tRNA pseudouridine38-40 synthase
VKVRLLLEYAGEAFHGWQEQPNQTTVQGTLSEALTTLLTSLAKRNGVAAPEIPHIQGSGRTDAGVHARGQVASFTWPASIPLDVPRLFLSLNAITPRALSILKVEQADDDFDARFSPHLKCYCYRIIQRRAAEGLRYKRAWRVSWPLNLTTMIAAAKHFEGQHDFSSFRAADCSAETTIRTVLRSEIVRSAEDEICYFVYGTGFLKQMIRIMTGTLVDVGRGIRGPDDIPAIIEARDRTRAGLTAPPDGLTMEWVRYLDRQIF